MTTKAAGGKITGLLALTFEAQEALSVRDFVHIVDDYEVEKADGTKPVIGSVSVANTHRNRTTGAYPEANVPGDCTVESRGFWVGTYVSGGSVAAGTRVGVDSNSRIVQLDDVAVGDVGNEVVDIYIDDAAGGTWAGTVGGDPFGPVAYNAAGSALVTALEATATIGVGDITVVKSTVDGQTRYRLTGAAAFAGENLPAITVDGALLTPADTADASTSVVTGGGGSNPNEVGIALTSTAGPGDPIDVLVR